MPLNAISLALPETKAWVVLLNFLVTVPITLDKPSEILAPWVTIMSPVALSSCRFHLRMRMVLMFVHLYGL